MKIIILVLLLLLPACVTMSGNYEVSGYDAGGNLLTGKTKITAQGSGIYNARNAICMAYPKANVVIKDINTGNELKSESPYQCK